MSEVLHGNGGGDQLNVSTDKTQVYGLSGNDTIVSVDKVNVLLIGGSGKDRLIMSGGSGTLSGGAGNDTFELNYSDSKSLSAVIEDFAPHEDTIVVNFDGNTVPQLTKSTSGSDVVLSDGTRLNVTLKGVRENDYFDGTGNAEQDDRFFEILKLTNNERENPTAPNAEHESIVAAAHKNLPWLTLSDGLTKAASIRAEEIVAMSASGIEISTHKRPNGKDYSTVFNDVGKHYPTNGENIHAGSSLAADAMSAWIGSLSHHKNILSIDPNTAGLSYVDYSKLGVGYAFVEEGSLSSEEHYYWEQLFGGSLSEVTSAPVDLSDAVAGLSIAGVSMSISEGDDTINNTVTGVTISALGGNDSITNSGFKVSISGDADNDTIDNSGSFTTISGGSGNDSIKLSNAAQDILIKYASGDGSDTVNGFDANDKLSLSGVTYTPVTVGNNIVVSLGADSITFVDAADFSFAIEGGTRSKFYIGTTGNDNIDVTGVDNATIKVRGGNDTINGFDGNDTLQIVNDEYYSVTSGSDLILRGNNNSITLKDAANLSPPINIVDESDQPVSVGSLSDAQNIVGTPGADNLNNTLDGAKITALGGDDTITNSGTNVTIDGGADNDSVNNSGRNVTYIYESGDDTISGFDDHDSLNIGNYNYSTAPSGNDVVVNVINNGASVGTVTLKDYPSGQEVNIDNAGYRPQSHVPGKELSDDGPYSFITGTNGDDTITNESSYVTIDALAGNDSIDNWGYAYTESLGYDEGTVSSFNVSINAGDGYDTVSSGSNDSTILGGAGNDSIDNHGNSVLVEGGAGNDTLYNYVSEGGDDEANYSTIRGGTGNDFIDNHGNHALIEGGTGNDTIHNYVGAWRDDEAEYSTLLGGDGHDSIDNVGSSVSIDGGAGDDSINNDGDNVSIDGGAGDDFIRTGEYGSSVGANVSINGGDGNDAIAAFAFNVTINGGDGNDNIINDDSADNNILNGDAGDDVIYNNDSDSVTINGGAGNDGIINFGLDVIIDAGRGNDTIENSGTNVSMLGGTGDDRISLSADSSNNLVRYTLGDGNDTVWGITENDTLNVPADVDLNPANSKLTSLKNAQNDLIIRVRRNDNNEITGSIILVGAANHPPKITYGESNTSGGGSIGNDSDGGSSEGSGGNQPGGGGTTGGTSGNEGNTGAISGGGRSASGSSGRTESNRGGNGYRFMRNEHSTTENAPTATSNALPDPVAQLNHQTTATTQQTSTTQPTTATRHVYTGGNQVIADYAAGEQIVFGATYTGAFYDGNGNFFAGSTTGALAVQNAVDKVIDLRDAAGNSFVKAYAATTAGVIDGRGLLGFEVINGSAGSDAIYAGDGGSQLWGGADSVSDAMMGGNGTDIFIGGRTQGADFFLNASSADIVHLNDTTLSDIVATAEENGTIGIAFNTGNVVAVQSSEALSATVMLADGSAYRFNHANKSWQSA